MSAATANNASGVRGAVRSTLADTWLLITLRWQLAWNNFWSRKLAAKVLSVIATLSLAIIAVGV